MPFTVSHAIVALPFRGTRLVPAAIAIGAMTPDLPVFFRGILPYGTLHSYAWLPLTVALAAALFVVWRFLLRPAVGELSPTWLAKRLPASWNAGMRATARETFEANVTWLALSLVIGVLTHLVWDEFTHGGRLGERSIPALGDEIAGAPVYGILQNLSSLVGLIVLAVWAIAWLRRARVHSVMRIFAPVVRWVWWLSLPAMLVFASINTAPAADFSEDFEQFAYRVMPPVVAVWACMGIALALVCFLTQLGRGRPADDAYVEEQDDAYVEEQSDEQQG